MPPRLRSALFCLAMLASAALQGQAPTITEFPLPDGVQGPFQIASGPDGNLWFTVQGARSYIGRITPVGSISLFPVPTPLGYPAGITAGPDGNLWFTETQGNKIGRLSPWPPNELTEFPLPTPNSQPAGIAAGPDGNLWFCETSFGNSKIGRISPAGAITEFDVPTADGSPQPITGLDGNLWFTYSSPNARRIGRITPAGAVTEIPFPPEVLTKVFVLNGIARGPDGNLWSLGKAFDGHDQLVRVTPAGAFSMFPIPTQFSEASVISAGPDGNLWFVEENGGKLARATTSGTVTEFQIPTPASSAGITTGPDGNVWFTEFYPVNQIARVNLQPLLTALSPAKVWVGLRNGDDAGLRLDLLAEVFVNGTRVGRGQLNNVNGGGSGFIGAILQSIDLSLTEGPLTLHPNDALKLAISARRTCSGGGHSSGTARLWYNGQPIDSGAGRAAGTRFDATIAGSTSDYFARDGFALSATAGSSALFVDRSVNSGAPCPSRPFAEFGSWSMTWP